MKREHEFYTVQQIRQRLSMSTLVFWQYRPIGEDSLSDLVRHGITQIELVESPEQFDMADMRSMKNIGEICRSCGIQIAAFHAHSTNFSCVDTDAKRIARVDRCRRQIDSMLELGGRLWGSHATVMDEALLKSYEELARHIDGTDAAIAIENFQQEQFWVENRLAFLDRIGHPQVGMILDVGHVRNSAGINPMTVVGGPTRVLEMCSRHLRWVHLHGFKDGKDHYPPFADGDDMQWVEVFQMLRKIGYTANFNFEPRGEPLHHDAVKATALAPERIADLEARTHAKLPGSMDNSS